MDRVARLPDFIPADAGADVLELVAWFGATAALLLIVAGIVDGLRAFHGWLMSYIDGGQP